jgi:hypothetical protein
MSMMLYTKQEYVYTIIYYWYIALLKNTYIISDKLQFKTHRIIFFSILSVLFVMLWYIVFYILIIEKGQL